MLYLQCVGTGPSFHRMLSRTTDMENLADYYALKSQNILNTIEMKHTIINNL